MDEFLSHHDVGLDQVEIEKIRVRILPDGRMTRQDAAGRGEIHRPRGQDASDVGSGRSKQAWWREGRRKTILLQGPVGRLHSRRSRLTPPHKTKCPEARAEQPGEIFV